MIGQARLYRSLAYLARWEHCNRLYIQTSKSSAAIRIPQIPMSMPLLILMRLLAFLVPTMHSNIPSCQLPFRQCQSFHVPTSATHYGQHTVSTIRHICWIVAYRAWVISGMWLCGSDVCSPGRGFAVFTFYAGKASGIVSIISFTLCAITHMVIVHYAYSDELLHIG